MLAKLHKLRLLVRLQAVFNIALLVILIFYLCQVVILEYLESHNSHSNEPTLCWILWITITLIAIIIIPLELTADVFIFKDMNDTLRSIQKYTQWLRISILFVIIIFIALLLSLFCPLSPSSIGGFILMFVEIFFRTLGMYFVYQYRSCLQTIVITETIETGLTGENNGIVVNGGTNRNGTGRPAPWISNTNSSATRSISVSPDFMVIGNVNSARTSDWL